MARKCPRTVGVLLGLLSGCLTSSLVCQGQLVLLGPAEPVTATFGTDNGPQLEVAVGRDPTDPFRAVIAWIDWTTGSPQHGWVLRRKNPTTGLIQRINGVILASSIPGCGSASDPRTVDPYVVFDDQSGDAFTGGFFGGCGTGIWVAKLASGATSWGAPTKIRDDASFTIQNDKPLAAIGVKRNPDPCDGGDPDGRAMYVGWTRTDTMNPPLYRLVVGRSQTATGVPLGSVWDFGPDYFVDTGQTGIGAALAVLPLSAGKNAGRIVLAYHGPAQSFDSIRVIWSDDAGVSWSSPVILPSYAEPAYSDVPGESRLGPRLNIAVDPETSSIYVAYDTLTAAGDVDVVVARALIDPDECHSLDFGSDAWARITGPTICSGTVPSDQWMPAIAVDACGNVHIMWFDTRNQCQQDSDTTGYFDVYYMRRLRTDVLGTTRPVTRFTTGGAAPFPDAHDFSFGASFGGGTCTCHWLGDYHQGSAADGVTTLAYMRMVDPDGTGPRGLIGQVFLRMISSSCADFSMNGKVEPEDVELFAKAFADGQLIADLDGDGALMAKDMELFLLEYADRITGGGCP